MKRKEKNAERDVLNMRPVLRSYASMAHNCIHKRVHDAQWHRDPPKIQFNRNAVHTGCPGLLAVIFFFFLFCVLVLVSALLVATYMCLNRWHCKIEHIYMNTHTDKGRMYSDSNLCTWIGIWIYIYTYILIL